MGLQLIVTDAGRAAIVDGGAGGYRAVRVAQVGVSDRALAATPQTGALPGEVKRIGTVAGTATAADTIHLTVTDESADAYTIRSLALYLADGTLFAAYGQAEPIVEKSAQALLLLALDVALVDLPATAITFGSADFLNPAATSERFGVVRYATRAEVAAGQEARAAIAPRTAASVYAALSGATFTDNVRVAAPGAGQVALAQSGDTSHTGYVEFCRPGGRRDGFIGFAAPGSALRLVSESGFGFAVEGGPLLRDGNRVWDAGNDGAGSGLDADLLDGRDGAAYALLSGATFTDNVRVAAPGAGQAVLAQSGNTTHTGYVAFNRPDGTREGFIGFAAPGGALRLTSLSGLGFAVDGGPLLRDGNRVWDAGNDGAGSGLDADLLDGRDGAAYALLSGATFTDNVRVAAPSAGAAVLAQSGNATHTGYVDFIRPDGTREGFIGFAAPGGALRLASLSGNGFGVDGGPLFRDGYRVWDLGNDGAGSGLDADLLDGWHADDLRDWANLLRRPAAFPPLAHAHGAADLAGAFPGTLDAAGYVVLPNGLILQWVTGAVQGPGSEGAQTLTLPISFPHACLQVLVTTQINDVGASHAVHQLSQFTVASVTVTRRLSAAGDVDESAPRVLALGW